VEEMLDRRRKARRSAASVLWACDTERLLRDLSWDELAGSLVERGLCV